MNMHVHFKPDPLSDELTTVIKQRMSIAQMLEAVDAPQWFWEYGAVTLNGHLVPRDMWKFVTPKHDAIIRLTVVPQGDNVLPIVAGLALVALTAGIATFGVPFLGAGFAAGTLGASAVSTGVGVLGSLAISAFTAPSIPSAKSPETSQLSNAGIHANALTKYAPLPVVVGKVRFSPPFISSSYTTFEDDELTVHARVGLEGRNLVEEVWINGLPLSHFALLESETREGAAGDDPLTLAPLTCIQKTNPLTLSNFKTRFETLYNDVLVDQSDPAQSSPTYHSFLTDGIVDEIWIRLLFPAGIIDAGSDSDAFIPIRIEIRKVGDVSWRNLPTCHIQDLRHGNGPLRVEIKLKFQTQPSGRHFSNALAEYPIFELTNITMIGQSPEYQSDAYFQQPSYTTENDNLPVMTAATTSSFTQSASSELAAGQAAWKASDTDQSTPWQPANNSLPAWHKTQCASARTYRSYRLGFASATDTVPTTAALTWYVEGSNDGTNWTRLDDENVDISANPLPVGTYQIGNPGSYLYYRINFLTNNGAANQQIAICDLQYYLDDAVGIALGHDSSIFNGYPARHSSGGDPRSVYGSLNKNGAEFYLDPAQWLPGEYEVRIKRGRGNDMNAFDPVAYRISGSTTSSDFFEHFTSSGKEVIRYSQKEFRTDCQVEVFSSVSYDDPVDTTGLTCIALKGKSIIIENISALFTSYGHEYLGDNVWDEIAVPTQNNAALFKEVLNGYGNFVPISGDSIDLISLQDWFGRCVSASHTINAVFQDRSILDVLNTIAYTGMASVKNSNLVGVVEDYDRSAEGVAHPISPMNSECLGQIFEKPELPDALYVDFNDEDDDYRVNRVIVYRRGFDVNNARIFDTMTYEGLTTTAAVTARATFDLAQLEARSVVYQYKMGLNGFIFEKGTLARLSDDVVDEHRGYGHIQEIELSGANVVSITLENVMPYGAAQDNIETIEDITAVSDIMDGARAMAVSISLTDGNALVKQVTNVVDSNKCIFTTPFDYAASGIELGNFVSMGVLGNEVRRCYVSAVEPLSLTERIVDLRDCAYEELF